MRIFASVDTFVESTASSLRLGRLVANATFLESLLREGRFDRHVLFCPTEAERTKLQDFLRSRPDGERLLETCDLRPLWDLPRSLREESFSVMHCGGWSRYLPPLAWLRAQHSPRPVPFTGLIHSINNPDQAVQIRRLVESPLRACDAVFCTSTEGRVAFANQIARVEERQGLAFQGTLRHVPLGVDERYFQLPDRTQARRRQSIAPHRVVALWIGRLSPASKADLVPLLYQWRLLIDQLDIATLAPLLVLAGGASPSDELALRTTIQELKLGDSVRLLRDIEDATKLDLLAASDVFVSPIDNHQETFGIAVVEAMAAGLPVVCSDWDGYRDLVEHEVHGIRVPVFVERPVPEAIELRGLLEPDLAQLAVSQSVCVDPSALREALALLLREPTLRATMGQAARLRARERFSWKAVLAQADEVWKELADQALSVAWPPSSAMNPEILDPHDVFANYPTGQFPSALPLRFSRLGEKVLAGKVPMPATWQDLVPISDGGLMTTLVVDLRGKMASYEDLATHAANKCRKSLPEARAMLAWLIKYGILEEVR